MKKISEFKSKEEILELLDNELIKEYNETIEVFNNLYRFMTIHLPIHKNSKLKKVDEDSLTKRVLYLIYQYKNHQIPYNIEDDILHKFCFRDLFIKTQGYALVTKKWIDPLANFLKDKKCIELFAGLGTITKALKDKGIDIIATDSYEWVNAGHQFANNRFWTDIEMIDALKAIEKYKDADYFIISWCPYCSEASYEALMKMREIAPNARLIHIGENYEGCTDSDKFFENIEVVDDEYFINNISYNFDSWDGIHDCISLLK